MQRLSTFVLGLCLLAGFVLGPAVNVRGDELTPEERQELRRQWKRHADKAITQMKAGKLDEAIAEMEQVYELEKRLSGEADKQLDRPLDVLLKMYEQKGDAAGLRGAHRRRVGLYTRLYGADHWRTAEARWEAEFAARRLKFSADQRRRMGQTSEQVRRGMELFRRGEMGEAAGQFREAAETIAALLGEDNPYHAFMLGLLAGALRDRGDLAAAEAAYTKALAAQKKWLGEDHPETVLNQYNLGGVYQFGDDDDRALPLYRASLKAARRLIGEGALSETSLHKMVRTIGLFYLDRDDWDAAQPLLEEAARLSGKRGEDDAEHGRDLANLSYLYRHHYDFRRAEANASRAAAIARKAADRPLEVAHALFALGQVHHAMGRYADAAAELEQARQLFRRTVGEKHSDYLRCLTTVGPPALDRGDIAAAKGPLTQVAQAWRERAGGGIRHAHALHNLGLLSQMQGDYARAEEAYSEALRLKEKWRGADHIDCAITLENLGGLYQNAGEPDRAEKALRRAEKLHARVGEGPDSPRMIHCLLDLADLYEHVGRPREAVPLCRQARDLCRRTLGENHRIYADSLQLLACAYRAMGDDAGAEALYREVIDRTGHALGEKNPRRATALFELAFLHAMKGAAGRGLESSRQALHIVRAHLDLTAAVQSERQQLILNVTGRTYLSFFLGAAAGAPADDAYAEVLAWKGAVSLRQQQMRRLRHEPIAKPETARLYADLEASTRRLGALINAMPGPGRLDDYRRRLEEANAEVEQRQQDLAAASAAFRKDLERRRRTPAELRRALPDGVALVDLVEYGHLTPQSRKLRTLERRLAAFVICKDRPVVRVELGPVESLAEDVEQWLKGLPQRRRPVFGDDDPAVKLRERLWEPLEPHLRDAATVLISPDGEVARLPWGALPGATPDRYLIEERAIAVVAVPQFLPELLAADKGAEERPPGLLLVGDVDYGASPGKADVEVASRGLPAVLQRGGGLSWGRLPATEREVATIRGVFERCTPGGTAKLLVKDGATESAVREQAPRHAWLHLATHGYFAPHKVQSALERDKRRAAPALSLAEQRGFVGFPQGLLSGVVLAGANKGGGEGDDDGVLTALEVAELDLRGCRLAVLSACETGLGEKAGGEGLLGLQRAFQIAGARSAVASLWSVPDEATRALMERFYDNLWQRKMGRLEALRQAQLHLLAEGVPGGAAGRGDKKGRTPPLYWAAFVLSGDWR